MVPKPGFPVINATREERYLRNFREKLPSSAMYVIWLSWMHVSSYRSCRWFPDDFLQAVNPDGVRGHYYHVNPWPLYYMIPDSAVL